MNNKYKISYILILLSIITISLLSYNLYLSTTKHYNIYKSNLTKLNTLNSNIKKKKKNIVKLSKEVQSMKNEIPTLNTKKSELEDKYKTVLNEKQKESNGVGKIIYLTFDDGPSIYTDSILDILDKYNVKATFFVTCKENTTEFAKKYKEKGHTIALHTCTHDYKEIYSSEENYFNDLNKVNDLVKKENGKDVKYIRFPGGSSNTVSKFNKGLMTTLTNEMVKRGYKYYDWNIDSMDASGYSSDKEYEHVIKALRYSTRQTNMILMHDIKISTKDSLERIIVDAKNMGYEFSNITDFTPEIHHTVNN